MTMPQPPATPAGAPSVTDQLLSRTINFVGSIAVTGVLGHIALPILNQDVPDPLTVITATAVGSLGTMLAGRVQR